MSTSENAPIMDRLHHRLFEPDKANIRDALLKYLLDHDLDGSEVEPDLYLADQIMPYLVKISGTWKDLATDIMWKDSVAHKHLLEYLKNQLRRSGYYINRKLKEAKGEEDATNPDAKVAETASVSKTTRGKRSGTKRTNPADEQSESDHVQEGHAMKYQRVDEQQVLAKADAKAGQTQVKKGFMSEHQVDVYALFREFHLHSSNIQGHRNAIAMIYPKWHALKEELQPYLDDPTQMPK